MKRYDKYCITCGKKLGWSAKYQPQRGIKYCVPCSKTDRWKKLVAKTNFKKGFTPWNKGLHINLNPSGSFKKGIIPWNKNKPVIKIRGQNHWNWKGGISNKRRLEMGRNEYVLWRVAVFIRDEYKCQLCYKKNGQGKTIRFVAHHIKPWAKYPEFRYAIDNGITLCEQCHYEVHYSSGAYKLLSKAGGK